MARDMALVLVMRSRHGFEGKSRRGRVFRLRPKEGAPASAFDPAHWAGRGCIRFHDDVSSTVSRKDVNRRLCAAWDAVCKNPPAWMRTGRTP